MPVRKGLSIESRIGICRARKAAHPPKDSLLIVTTVDGEKDYIFQVSENYILFC